MLPSGGWDLNTYLNQEFLPPRNEHKYPLIAKCHSFNDAEDIWTLRFNATTQQLDLYDGNGSLDLSVDAINVISCDFAFDRDNRYVIVWEDNSDNIYIRYYDPFLSAYDEFYFSGNNPCCCVDNIRDNVPEQADVFVFFQQLEVIRYVEQSDLFDAYHTVTTVPSLVKLVTCGMTTDSRLSLKTQQQDCILFAIGTKPMAIGDDYVGYPSGVVPWDRN